MIRLGFEWFFLVSFILLTNSYRSRKIDVPLFLFECYGIFDDIVLSLNDSSTSCHESYLLVL
jgi:hypothetical protein